MSLFNYRLMPFFGLRLPFGFRGWKKMLLSFHSLPVSLARHLSSASLPEATLTEMVSPRCYLRNLKRGHEHLYFTSSWERERHCRGPFCFHKASTRRLLLLSDLLAWNTENWISLNWACCFSRSFLLHVIFYSSRSRQTFPLKDQMLTYVGLETAQSIF